MKSFMATKRHLSGSKRFLRWGTALSFLFFLAASAPHRVHHFFEQPPFSSARDTAHAHTHEYRDGEPHSHHDHHNPQPKQQSDCVVLTVAQNAHASVVHAFDFSVLASTVARFGKSTIVTASSFNPAPFSQRAPPQA